MRALELDGLLVDPLDLGDQVALEGAAVKISVSASEFLWHDERMTLCHTCCHAAMLPPYMLPCCCHICCHVAPCLHLTIRLVP